MNKVQNTFIIGFSEECSFPEVIEKLANQNIIKISQWVTTNKRGTIDLFEFYHGRYFNERNIKNKISRAFYNEISKYLLEFCFVNSRTNLSHNFINKFSSNIYHEVHEFNKFVQLIYDIFIEDKIELVLFQEIPHDGPEIVLYRLAKIMNIKTIILTNFSHFWGRCFVFYSMEDFGDFNEIPDLSNDEKDAVVNYQDFKSKMFYMKTVNGYTQKIANLEKVISKFKKKYFENKFIALFLPRKKIKLEKLKFSLLAAKAQHYSSLEYKSNMENITNNEIDLTKKYIYFALHLDPEISTMPILAGDYCDQLNAMERLSTIIPDDMLIYVKENPKQTDILRPNSFFDRIKKLKNVKMVNLNTYELIDNSCFVATIAGTAGWEAITAGKNVLIFGKSWYQNLPGVFKFDENININQIINYKINKTELEDKLQKLIKKSSKGMIYFEFQNKSTNIKEIYSEYERQNNINYLYQSIRKLIEN